MNSVRIELLGSSFSIQTDEDPAYIESLVLRIKNNIDTVRSQTKTEDPLKLSILSSIMLADEIHSLLASQKPESPSSPVLDAPEGAGLDEAERIALRLISDIDDRLPR